MDAKTVAGDGAEALGDLAPIERMFVSQIDAFHCHRASAEESGGRAGSTWIIDPAYGEEGVYWYYIIDDAIAVASFSFFFKEDVSFSCDTPDLFCFGSYGRHMVPYFGSEEDTGDRTLLGYAWRGGDYVQHVRAGDPLTAVSFSLFPQAARRLSLACNCDPLTLTSAIASLDGTVAVPGLTELFEEVRLARPLPVTAKAYYQAKITEACAVLVDWHLRRRMKGAPRIRPVDRTALNLARALIEDNLDRTVTSEELCRAACMSESKLAGLFKRAEGTTPQAYARSRKLERARDLLLDTDRSVADIAASVGYERQGSFSEAFKERFGTTPLAYRRESRNR